MHHLVRAVILGAFTFAMGPRSVAQELPLTIQWPLDIQEDCSLTLEDIDPGMPMLIGPEDCAIDSSVFVDELLETECAQNVRIERTWTVYACEQEAEHVQTIEFLDTEPPVLHPQTIGQIGQHICVSEVETLYPFFTDNCESGVVNASVIVYLDTICPGVIEASVQYDNVTDQCGNEFSDSHLVYLHDDEPGFISVPEDVTYQCGETFVLEEPEYGDCELTYEYEESYNFPECVDEIITRSFSLTNLCGTTTTATQTIFVVDTLGPVIGMPADLTVSCLDGHSFDEADISLTNGCGSDGPISLVTSLDTVQFDCGRDVVWTATATDACGNTSTATQTVSFVDNIGPMFAHIPDNATVSCSDDSALEALFEEVAVAIDACSNVTLTEGSTTIPGSCPSEYTIVRSFHAVDGCGNERVAEQVIEVIDDEAPSVLFASGLAVDSVVLSCDLPLPAPELTVEDACSTTTMTTSVSTSAGSCNGNVVKDFTITVTDACGNATAVQRVVTLIDTIAPVFQGPATLTVSCDEDLPTESPEVEEGCSFLASLTFEDEVIPGECLNESTVLRQWTAIDACGNASMLDQTIMVVDDSAPSFLNLPEDTVVAYASGMPFGLDAMTPAPDVDATDNCTPQDALIVTVTTTPGDTTEQQGVAVALVVQRVFAVSDACGNATEATQTWTLGLPVFGCTDSNACNYSDVSNEDDGTCTYPDPFVDCSGICLVDEDGDGVCDELEVLGCTNDAACNFDASATEDDGSCQGPAMFYDCEGVCVNDADGDGVCDELEVSGCTDSNACNYSPSATDDDGSCSFPPANLDCEGNCVEDADGDGICDPLDPCVGGYDACGICNGDGSFCTGCTDPEACNYETLEDGTWSTNFGLANDPAVKTIMVNGNDGSYEFVGTLDVLTLTSEAVPTLQVSFVGTLTVEGTALAGQVSAEIPVPNGTNQGTYTFDIVAGEAAYEVNATLDADMEAMLSGTVSGFSLAAFQGVDACAYPETSYLDCDGVCFNDLDGDGVCDEAEVLGCTDVMACNFDGVATEEDGSCTYPEQFYGCDGTCVNDADNDGVCDELEEEGCLDDLACNYSPSVTEDDGTCTYPPLALDCAGNCLNDADGDGVCDEFETFGCTDATACNYDASATEEDGSCTGPEAFVDCEGNCELDEDEDGICDQVDPCVGAYDQCGVCNGDNTLCFGCLDEEACNYSMLSAGTWSTNVGTTDQDNPVTLLVTGVEGDYAYEGSLLSLEVFELPGSDIVEAVFEGILTAMGEESLVQVELVLSLENGIANPPSSLDFFALAGDAVYALSATLEGDSGMLSGALAPFSLTYFGGGPESCIYPEDYADCSGNFIPESVCGEGTVFDVATGLCVPATDCTPGPSACGEFTVWDEALQQCVPDVISAACYYDVNGSGLVDTQDLIEFLAAFGQACE